MRLVKPIYSYWLYIMVTYKQICINLINMDCVKSESIFVATSLTIYLLSSKIVLDLLIYVKSGGFK